MNTFTEYSETKMIFKEKGTCSQTLFFLLNRTFSNNNGIYERASDLLAGGLMNRGCQCGMLWGASLAIGKECFRRYPNSVQRNIMTMETTKKIINSFSLRTGSINCRDVTGCDFTRLYGVAKYALITLYRGIMNNPCFILAERWVPEAIQTASESLQELMSDSSEIMSCASMVAEKMDASEEEKTIVAGFAGGLGLSGNACGALAAVIWLKMVRWCEQNPLRNPPFFQNKIGRRIVQEFFKETGSEVECHKICGKKFTSVDDHTKFIKNNGCCKLIDRLASIGNSVKSD